MDAAGHAKVGGWQGHLALWHVRDGNRTVLRERRHTGPLVVQKSLYPEGDAVCQNIIVHPPGGIVGGDSLIFDASVGPQAHAQFTTPGAAKWYRSAGAAATQRLALRAAAGAVLEWLPQETILFGGAIVEMESSIELDGDAVFIGWDIVCLGRTASGERFGRGVLKHRVAVRRDGVPVFIERGIVRGGSRILASSAGLDEAPVFGTFFAACRSVSDALLHASRSAIADSGEATVTRLPGLLLGRFLGSSAEAARRHFRRLWQCARAELIGRDAVMPRIWST
jgi:urease accessory protein